MQKYREIYKTYGLNVDYLPLYVFENKLLIKKSDKKLKIYNDFLGYMKLLRSRAIYYIKKYLKYKYTKHVCTYCKKKIERRYYYFYVGNKISHLHCYNVLNKVTFINNSEDIDLIKDLI